MEKNATESPDKWVILKLPENLYKVFGTWNGGYLEGDSWKLNSGIEKVDQDEDFYYFIGFSGSCYKCHKGGYGLASSFGSGVLNKIMEASAGEIELMEDSEDWESLILPI